MLSIVIGFALLAWLPGEGLSSSTHVQISRAINADHIVSAPSHSGKDTDCGGATVICCMMSMCHPAISIDPVEMPTVANLDEAASSVLVQSLGNEPAIILPPPREIPV